MTLTLLLICLVGYVVMAAVFVVSAAGSSRRVKWFGLVAIVASAPFFYWLGAFSEQATSGICYSAVVEGIANSVEQTNSPKLLAKQIRELPMRGYETSCSEVQQAAHGVWGQRAP
jgi:hypothetical protein